MNSRESGADLWRGSVSLLFSCLSGNGLLRTLRGFAIGRIFTGIHPAPLMRLRQRADFRVNSSEAAYTAFSVDRSFGKIRLPPLFADERVFEAVCSIV